MIPILFQFGVGVGTFGGFQQILSNMISLGFFQFLFPFLLALAIFYGILNKFAGDKFPKSAISLISLILAFFVMLFALANPSMVGILQNLSGWIFITGSGLLFLIILLGIAGIKLENLFGEGKGKIALGLLIAVVFIVIFFVGVGFYFFPSLSIGSDIWTIAFFVIILALVFWFLGREGGGGGGNEKKPAR